VRSRGRKSLCAAAWGAAACPCPAVTCGAMCFAPPPLEQCTGGAYSFWTTHFCEKAHGNDFDIVVFWWDHQALCWGVVGGARLRACFTRCIS
jgi:hypothetical protein